MESKQIHPVIQQQIDCLVNHLKQSGLLISPSDVRMSESVFNSKLVSALHQGIIDFNINGGKGPVLTYLSSQPSQEEKL